MSLLYHFFEHYPSFPRWFSDLFFFIKKFVAGSFRVRSRFLAAGPMGRAALDRAGIAGSGGYCLGAILATSWRAFKPARRKDVAGRHRIRIPAFDPAMPDSRINVDDIPWARRPSSDQATSDRFPGGVLKPLLSKPLASRRVP